MKELVWSRVARGAAERDWRAGLGLWEAGEQTFAADTANKTKAKPSRQLNTDDIGQQWSILNKMNETLAS